MRFDHVAVPVSDPHASRRFYEGVFDVRIFSAVNGEDWGGYPWLLMFFALPGGGFIALSCFKGIRPEAAPLLPADARHIAISAADLDPWRVRLKNLGVAFNEEDHGPQHSLYFSDPDHNVWEITSPPGAGLDGLGSDRADAAIEAFLKA